MNNFAKILKSGTSEGAKKGWIERSHVPYTKRVSSKLVHGKEVHRIERWTKGTGKTFLGDHAHGHFEVRSYQVGDHVYWKYANAAKHAKTGVPSEGGFVSSKKKPDAS